MLAMERKTFWSKNELVHNNKTPRNPSLSSDTSCQLFDLHFSFCRHTMVNIGTEAGNFFQTDAELAKQKEKAEKYNYTEGDAVKLSSKALAIQIVADGTYVYIAESGFQTRRFNLKVK